MSRTPYQRRCHDCGSTARDTPFPGAHKPYKQVDRCTDCTAEFERLAARIAEASPGFDRTRPISTRAMYRAAYRHRVKQLQGDLVDLLVSPP